MDNPLTRWKRPIFKIRYSRNSQISVWKPNIFPRQAIPKCFLFYGLGTHGILHTQFGLIWTTPWPDEKDLFLKFVILEIRKFLYENLTFFLHKLYQKLFRFYALATQGILQTDFGSIWTSPWNRPILIISYPRNSQISVWKASFFPRQAIPKVLFDLHSGYPRYTPYPFGLIWTSPWPDEKDLFLKFVIREIRKFPYENLTFFLDKLYQNAFCFMV